MKKAFCFAAFLAVLLSAGAPTAAQPRMLDFNYGIPNSDQTAIFVAQDLNLYKKVGLQPKFYLFNSGAPLPAGLKSRSIDVTSRQAIERDPKVAIDALMKHLSLSEIVARADYANNYLKRPTFGEQISPSSPFSMTSKTSGLVRKLFLAGQALYEAKSIPEPVPMSVIEDAIDPSYLEAYGKSHRM